MPSPLSCAGLAASDPYDHIARTRNRTDASDAQGLRNRLLAPGWRTLPISHSELPWSHAKAAGPRMECGAGWWLHAFTVVLRRSGHQRRLPGHCPRKEPH